MGNSHSEASQQNTTPPIPPTTIKSLTPAASLQRQQLGHALNLRTPFNHIFDDGDAAADFENMLLPPAGAATITQPWGGGVPPLPQGGGHIGVHPLGVPLPPPLAGGGHPPTPPPHLPGGGGNASQQPAAGDEPYSGIGSAIKKLGYTMYDPATIKAKLAV